MTENFLQEKFVKQKIEKHCSKLKKVLFIQSLMDF